MKTILILDDDPSITQVLCALLWSNGYRVLEATTGNEAIEICNKEIGPIDLFVSDLQLPDLSGTEVALQLHESRPDVPILFVSGTPLIDWIERDLRIFRQLSPGADFLEKPFSLSTLGAKIGDLISHQAYVGA